MTQANKKNILRTFLVVGSIVMIVVLLGPILITLREPDDGKILPLNVPGRLIDVGSRRVHIVEQGEGPALLLVHGFGASTDDFEYVLAPLAKSHRVIAVDLFGFGWSERSDDFHYNETLWSDQLAGTLDALGIQRASVAGHSMGGAVAAIFAARYPNRVDRLILADSLYPLEPNEMPWTNQVMKTPVLGELALGLFADVSSPGYSTAYRDRALAWYRIRGTRRAFLQYFRDPNRRAELLLSYSAIAAPTLIIHGTADKSVLYSAMERIAPTIRAVRIVPISGGQHYLLRDTPEFFLREVEQFISEP